MVKTIANLLSDSPRRIRLAALVVRIGLIWMVAAAAMSPLAQESWNRPSVRLSLNADRAVMVGQLTASAKPQEIEFPKAAIGRYFCFESLSALDGRPYAAIAELQLLDDSGNPIPSGQCKISYADSEEHDRENGSAENAIDGDPETFWHTQWAMASPNHPHHLVIDLGEPRAIRGFRYLPRPGDGAAGGRIRDFRVYVGNDLVEQMQRTEALPDRCYLFAYFTGVSGEDGLHLAWSLNGYRWDRIDHGRVFFTPELGDENRVFRDPFLWRDPDGLFRMVWTASWTGNFIGYAESHDLIHWNGERLIPLMAGMADTANCWAPEMIWDPVERDYLVYWASAVTNQAAGLRAYNRIYSARTTDFKTFSPPRLMFDAGFGAVDATLMAAKGEYRMAFQDEVTHQLYVATGAKSGGPYGNVTVLPPFASGEGPVWIRAADQTIIGFHGTAIDRFFGVKSGAQGQWEDVSSALSLPVGTHQGASLELPGEALRPLLECGRLENGPSPQAWEIGVGDWIWTTNVTDKQTCRLWRQFEVPEDSPVLRAQLRVTADNGYTVFCDGKQVGRGGDANYLTEYDLTWLMSPGSHVLAIEAFNEAMDAGVIAGLTVKFANGKKTEVFSDPSWLVVNGDERGWQSARQPGASWHPAKIVGYGGRAWWTRPNKIAEAPPLLPPVIRLWQQTWVLAILLGLCILVAVLCLSFALRLAFQARAGRMLDRERSRIARDIHDDLGAGLTQLTLMGELVLREMPRESEALSRLNDLCARARALLGSMDEIVWAVNPKRDTLQDFAAFISSYTQEFLATTPVRCRLEVPAELPAAPLDLPARRNLLFAVKEAIRNAVRHSHATELTLTIGVSNDALRVSVEDNGRGFVPAGVSSRNGVSNMRQRLAEIGGKCSVKSAPNAGCRVTFDLPLAQDRWHLPKFGRA